MAQKSDIQDCWDGNRCSSDEHCGESGGICSSSLLWTNENNMNLTSQLQGQVMAIPVVEFSREGYKIREVSCLNQKTTVL